MSACLVRRKNPFSSVILFFSFFLLRFAWLLRASLVRSRAGPAGEDQLTLQPRALRLRWLWCPQGHRPGPWSPAPLPTSTRTVKRLKLPAQKSTLFALKGGGG